MRLISGRLYKVITPDVFFRIADQLSYVRVRYQKGCVVLFLEKGRLVPKLTKANYQTYTPYYFLFGEIKAELRKYYNDKLKDMFVEAGRI